MNLTRSAPATRTAALAGYPQCYAERRDGESRVSTPQADPAPNGSRNRHRFVVADLISRVGEFYRHPETNRKHRHVASLLVLGCAALLFLSLCLPYFEPPLGGLEYFLYLSGLTVLLGGVSVLRRERGAIGAAAAVAATGAVGLIVFRFVFAFGISWLFGVLMPN